MKLYTEEHGEGQPLLLLTGLGYAIWSWQRQLLEWSQRFRCIAVENRGTGRSPKPPGPYSIEQLADDAAEALAGRRAHVAGFRWAATSRKRSRSCIRIWSRSWC